MLPQSCPICNRLQVKPLLEEVRISAMIGGNTESVHGLVGYICEVNGHIFFVRTSDMENSQNEGGTSYESRRYFPKSA